jgi:hypothetical protein
VVVGVGTEARSSSVPGLCDQDTPKETNGLLKYDLMGLVTMVYGNFYFVVVDDKLHRRRYITTTGDMDSFRISGVCMNDHNVNYRES